LNDHQFFTLAFVFSNVSINLPKFCFCLVNDMRSYIPNLYRKVNLPKFAVFMWSSIWFSRAMHWVEMRIDIGGGGLYVGHSGCRSTYGILVSSACMIPVGDISETMELLPTIPYDHAGALRAFYTSESVCARSGVQCIQPTLSHLHLLSWGQRCSLNIENRCPAIYHHIVYRNPLSHAWHTLW